MEPTKQREIEMSLWSILLKQTVEIFPSESWNSFKAHVKCDMDQI